jgi:PAS domain S-box-containing protein
MYSMEIDARVLSVIERTNSGDYAVYRLENGALHVLLRSAGLPALSAMTPQEYDALMEKDAADIVLPADRPAVAARIADILKNADPDSEYPLRYRILHKTSGSVWIKARARVIGTSKGCTVLMVNFTVMSVGAAEYANLLDNADASVYVVDKNTYELLYVNQAASKVGGGRFYQTEKCYRYFCGFEQPCPWCTIAKMKNGFAHLDENYVPVMKRWFKNDVRDMDWYGHEAAAFYITDITDQKKRQDLDKERFDNLYHQIAAANPDALAMFRLNLTKNICSDVQSTFEEARKQQSSGTVDGYLEASIRSIADDRIRTECRRRFTLENLLKQFYNGVTEMSIEYPLKSSDGELMWINGTIAMMQNSVSGDVEGISYSVNITDRKTSEDILNRISEEKYDHIGLITPESHSYELWKMDGAYSLGQRQRVDYNVVFADILDHYISPEDRELFADHGNLQNIVARLNKDGSDTFVYRCTSQEGRCLYKQVRYTWLGSQHKRIMETQSDLTPLYEHQIEQVKRQHEEELNKERALSAESIPAGIGVFDYADKVLHLNYLNNGFYQMTGMQRSTYVNEHNSDALIAVYAEDRPVILQAMETAIREKRPLRTRFRQLDGRGQYRWVEITANHMPLNAKTERFYVSYYDIDDLIRMQKELQEKELVFRDILTYSDIIHFTYYPEEHRYESEILPARLSRLPRTMDDYPEAFIRYIKLDESDAASYRGMVKAIDAGAPEADCTVRMTYEGKSGWYLVHLMSVKNSSGQTVKAIGNVFNVDRTVEAERAIAEERIRVESLRGVYLATASFNVSKDTEIIFNAGSSLTRPLSIDADALKEAMKAEPEIGKQNPETLHTLLTGAKQIPDLQQRRSFIRCFSHEGMMRLYRSGRKDVTLEYQRLLNGELVWVATQVILMLDPRTGDVLAFFYTRDISEQKRTEQITRMTLEKNCDYIALIDVRKHMLKFRSISEEEKAYRDNWKIHAENSYETNMQTSLKRHMSGSDSVALLKQLSIENIVRNLEQAEEYSATYDRTAADGTVCRKQVRYRWLDETKTEILVMQTDITSTYIQEQERTRQLQEALAAAEKADSAKTEFISRISHDIRTPISAITNMTAFAKEDMDDREKLLHDLNRIQASNTFLLSLINDVLDISKIDSGRIELHPEPYPYEEYMESIRTIFEPLCLQHGLTFHLVYSHAAKGQGVVVDRVRYNQIALNLLSNAVKYTPAGGTVTYCSHAKKRADGMVECGFEISDTGIGMSEQFQKTMFEPFTQEFDNPERKKLASGTGLGLSIVKRLVDLMGGRIHVESAIGRGTTIGVDFVLPEIQTALPEAAQNDAGDTARKLAGTVLLAEDNEMNTEIAVRILEGFGLKIDCAEDGNEAVRMFEASQPGQYLAILMDIQMPNRNGYEATRAIRALSRPDAGTIPILAMTADAFEESIRAARKAGMNDYITKPIDPKKLYQILKKNILKTDA